MSVKFLSKGNKNFRGTSKIVLVEIGFFFFFFFGNISIVAVVF